MLTLRISVGRSRVDRGRVWIEKSGIIERGGEAWSWLRQDDRGRVVGLVVASVALSIALSVLATVLVRTVESRRGARAAEIGPGDEGEAHVEAEAVPAGAASAEPDNGEAPADG